MVLKKFDKVWSKIRITLLTAALSATSISIATAGNWLTDGLAKYDPTNPKSETRKGINHLGKEVAKLDPSKAIREEFERAKKAALKNLKKLDPGRINAEMAKALKHQIGRLQSPDDRTGSYDLRASNMGRSITGFLEGFAQGNRRSSALEEFSYNPKSRQVVLRLRVRHRHNWGRVVPGVKTPDLYDITQTARVRYSFKNSSVDFAIDLGPLAPKINSKTFQQLSDGNIIGALESAMPTAVGKLMGHEEKNDYDKRRNEYLTRYGAKNVYFASRQFVNAATPETIARFAGNAILTAGTSVCQQVMAEVRRQAQQEAPQLAAWLQARGIANAESIARELLSGRQPKSPFIKLEVIPVRYASRSKPLNTGATPWIKIDHLAFVIVWQDGGAAAAHRPQAGRPLHSLSAHPQPW